jgi:hypothetical protein
VRRATIAAPVDPLRPRRDPHARSRRDRPVPGSRRGGRRRRMGRHRSPDRRSGARRRPRTRRDGRLDRAGRGDGRRRDAGDPRRRAVRPPAARVGRGQRHGDSLARGGPPPTAHLYAWPLAGLAGYAATARSVRGRNSRDARLYATAAVLGAGTLGLALAGGPSVLVVALLGVCHALTLALIAGARTARAPYVLVGAYLLVVVAAGRVARGRSPPSGARGPPPVTPAGRPRGAPRRGPRAPTRRTRGRGRS